jgi:uncharacterized Zn-binding protein involved in type VI secretion
MKRFLVVLVVVALSVGVYAACVLAAPAARVTDQQTCPMVCPGPLPHVGGPILAPCAQSVLICGQPTARLGDLAQCLCGGNPTIISGSATVLIEGQPAARMADMTNHGGTIIGPGCPTVLIGP